ncbi:hypothetical protein ScPMuIL_010183 [Solemya velum]
MITNGLARQVYRLLKNISSLSLNQARISEWDPDDMCRLVVEICPSGGYYEGAKFKFVIILEDSFPEEPPKVFCRTPIYHPNIDSTDEEEEGYTVCLSMFEEDEWSNKMGLDECVIGLLYLLYNPNLEDPLSPWFSPTMDGEEFAEKVKKSLEGENVEEFQFQTNKENTLECSASDSVVNELSVVLSRMDLDNVADTNSDEQDENTTENVNEVCKSTEMAAGISETETRNDDSKSQEIATVDTRGIRITNVGDSICLSVILENRVLLEVENIQRVTDIFCSIDMRLLSSHAAGTVVPYRDLVSSYARPLSNIVTPEVDPCVALKISSPGYGEFTIAKDCWGERNSFVCALSRGNQANNREIMRFHLQSDTKIQDTEIAAEECLDRLHTTDRYSDVNKNNKIMFLTKNVDK